MSSTIPLPPDVKIFVIGTAVKNTHSNLEIGVRFPNERNQGKQAHPVLKYRVPHDSQRVMGRLVHTGLGSSSLVALSRENSGVSRTSVDGDRNSGEIASRLRVYEISGDLRLGRKSPDSFVMNSFVIGTAVINTHTQYRRQLIVSCSICPPLSPFPHANSFGTMIGTAVINTQSTKSTCALMYC
jgi:hypothetical protein